MKKIHIITGNIRAGKTTFLKKIISEAHTVEGILQPTIGEERFFFDLKSKQQKKITAIQSTDETFRIGKFIFNLNAFIWAKKKLSEALSGNSEAIVIDEYGPLEFKGAGLEPVASQIILGVMNTRTKKLNIIVRENLLGDFLKKFKLKKKNVEITTIKNQSNVLR